jgi:hypothetical protein
MAQIMAITNAPQENSKKSQKTAQQGIAVMLQLSECDERDDKEHHAIIKK